MMMELFVTMARATQTSMDFFIDIPINDLDDWIVSIVNVLKRENSGK